MDRRREKGEKRRVKREGQGQGKWPPLLPSPLSLLLSLAL
jgi:hypothetical protein